MGLAILYTSGASVLSLPCSVKSWGQRSRNSRKHCVRYPSGRKGGEQGLLFDKGHDGFDWRFPLDKDRDGFY